MEEATKSNWEEKESEKEESPVECSFLGEEASKAARLLLAGWDGDGRLP